MSSKDRYVAVQVQASHPSFRALIAPFLERPDIRTSDEAKVGVAQIVLDYPLTWALAPLERMDSIARARTLVVTQATHPAYLDAVASHHVSGVVRSTDANALLSGIYAAASSQRSYHWQSGLTYMELRVVRLLLAAEDTRDIAEALHVSYKTVNAHISNVLCKLGYSSRAQLVARLFGCKDNL